MKKLKKFFWIFFLVFGASFFRVSSLEASSLTKQASFIDGEENGWVVLVKEVDNQRFVLKFPERPSLEDTSDTHFCFSTRNKTMEYRLAVQSTKEKKDFSFENWMEDSLKELIGDPSVYLQSFFIDVGPYGPFMETIYIQEDQVIRERKFLQTDRIFSLICRGNNSGEDRFFDSFQIFPLEL